MRLIGYDENVGPRTQDRVLYLCLLQLKLLEGRKEKLSSLCLKQISKIIDTVCVLGITNQTPGCHELIEELVV